MQVFNRYTFKNLLIASVFITVTLSSVILLTQSLRFLELIIESGADVSTFWVLTFLALPRFLEILVPIAVMVATVFIYARMSESSELVILRTTGFSPLSIARPALLLGLMMTLFLWFVTMWAAPKSLSGMQEMRQMVKSKFSAALLREGVFNRLGKDITVYVEERKSNGELTGVLIYDQSDKSVLPSTVLAARGVITEQPSGYQVIVYNGSRQSFDRKSKVLQRLNFDRYTVDLPVTAGVAERWQQPDERTIFQLLNPDPTVELDVERTREFLVEVHRRFTAPLLVMAFVLISTAALILGPIQRRGQALRLGLIVVSAVFLQGLFIAAYNIARQNGFGIVLMYLVVVVPSLLSLFALSGYSEGLRRRFLYQTGHQRHKAGVK